MSDDRALMRHALLLARRNLGQTWPNPSVGAVIVKDGRVAGTGWTARSGRPHAEPQALAMAGADARGATLYVSLEPCAHQGQTPPCTEAIIKAGITRVVVACSDPHPDVNGRGIAALRGAGIEVIENICRAEAEALNAGFFSVVKRGRPYVALKIASSLDGKITNPNAKEKWLTSEFARTFGHLLRSEYDAILTGIGTALADDPLLTCRLPGLTDRSPVRIILDRNSRLPKNSKLMQSQNETPLWIERDTNDLPALLTSLASRGITRLLVEAGGTLNTAFIQVNLMDRVYWFRAPLAVGGAGMPAFSASAQGWNLMESLGLGPDRLDIFDIPAI